MENTFTPTEYKLQSIATGNVFEDTGWLLDAPGEEKPSLIRAIYNIKQIKFPTNIYYIKVFNPINGINFRKSAVAIPLIP